ncbi:uncharacterized protein LOC109022194 [Juglans regia]|uniref:Uncharacterized protein LOC109022194 n=1 Tax=Juglans regia TaxID=51240 RepID=A0A6P9E093_JUGRE|nr:uncharacterized protein LOC109022194 [Juglans regia]
MMLRTRVLWFGVGFSVVGAAIAQLIWRDSWTDRHALFSDTKQKFDALEARLLNLEATISNPKSDSGQAEG